MVLFFFLKKQCYYAFIVQKWENTHFLNEISSKNIKSLNGLRFYSCISISYIVRKFTQKFHSQLWFWSKYAIFSNFVTSIILLQIYSIHSKFSLFVELKK
jgi:hypothetical protein